MARKSPALVCQYLEKLSGKLLEKYGRLIRDFVRHRHGVYALYRRDRLYYVGLAINLRTRLKHHLKDRHAGKWDQFSVYLTIGDSHIRELETLILRIVRPPGNQVKGKLHKAEDLKRTLRQEFKKQAQLEMDELFSRKVRIPVAEYGQASKLVRQKGVLAQYSNGGFRLRGTRHGQQLRARVTKDGMILFGGKLYRSPSLAAIAASKHSRNGWTFWKYERAPGDWVRLKELRR